MKPNKRIVTALLMLGAVLAFMCVPAFAKDIGTVMNIHAFDTLTAKESDAVSVSCGLNVIAARCDMAIAGIKGDQLYFSEERFACAMNLSSVDSITVTKLPDAVCGALYVGSEGISVNSRIESEDIAMMTYEEAKSGGGSVATFHFRVNDSAYDIACNIYMLDSVNYSPTVSLASYASLNAETYRDIAVSGVLSAYDPESDPMCYEIVRYPSHGRLVLDNPTLGTYTYTPNDSYSGEDSFLYVAKDQYGNYSASARVRVGIATSGTATVYSDLADDMMHSHAIAVTECGLMNGIQIGDYYYFEADREVSRAEFVVTAMNAIGIKNVPNVTETVFHDDCDIGAEMKGYVALAYSKGYISGKSIDGNLCFKPDEPIRLAEAAVIISNMIGYAEPRVASVFADADEIPSWSEKAIGSLYTLGILEAPDMYSGASITVTRGDMAKLLNKTMFVIGKK